MTDILYWMGVAFGVLVVILLLITVAGYFMPRSHQVSRSLTIKQSPQVIWEAITNFSEYPNWHPDMLKTERLEDRNGHAVWKETYKGNYPILLETTEEEKMKKLVRTIADINGPFSGRWEFTIDSSDSGSRLQVTEYGEIPNPFFRCMARLFMNSAYYLEVYLKALAKKFGEEAEPQEK